MTFFYESKIITTKKNLIFQEVLVLVNGWIRYCFIVVNDGSTLEKLKK